MNLKRFNGLVLALSSTAMLFGCNSFTSEVALDDFNANDYLSLYDYKTISLSKEDISVSEEEIDSVILFDLQSRGYFVDEKMRPIEYGDFVVADVKEEINGIETEEKDTMLFLVVDEDGDKSEQEFYRNMVGKIPGEKIEFSILDKDATGKKVKVNYEVYVDKIKSQVTELTDEIVKEVYGYKSLEKARIDYKKMIIDGRILDTVKNELVKNSRIIGEPSQKAQFIKELENDIIKLAQDDGVSVENYCLSNFDMTESEYFESVDSFFDEYMIIKAISEKEGYTYTAEDVECVISQMNSEENTDAEEYAYFYSTVGILYSMRYNDLKNILINNVMNNIK